MLDVIKWEFPLLRPHTGMMFGNGTSGLLVWGEGEQLRITIGRADFWDHRGGMSWTEKQNYTRIRSCLERNDADGIAEIFSCDTEKVPGMPERPSVVPVGRMDLQLPPGALLCRGELELRSGSGMIFYHYEGCEYGVKVALAMRRQVFTIELPPEHKIGISVVPSAHIMQEEFKQIGIAAPELLNDHGVSGWIQPLPSDPALCVGYRCKENVIWSVTARDTDFVRLRQSAESLLNQAVGEGIDIFKRELRLWWDEYWADVPKIETPNEKIDFIYYFGLYKFAAFTNPEGIPATLQGPWIEEYRFPPWSSDYHFNINVQMCYWPAYKANRLSHLLPMFNMVFSWKGQLRHNARCFVGIDDGYMMPHAVDDRCTCMGSFWTGTIDHGCSAWIAQMMYQYYLYSGDLAFLRDEVFDFMRGVMRVYEAMLEKKDGVYVLPVSVSPEYRGDRMDAWGVNASFQLAAIHRMCEDLIDASTKLGMDPDAKWLEIRENLPLFSVFVDGENAKIGLWDGTDLEESHRHHSHLASICPFDTIDYTDVQWSGIVNNTLTHWIKQGMGLWTGWCMPWASMLHSRLKNGPMAELILEIWQKVFTNEGHGTLHDVNFPGLSLMGAAPMCASAAPIHNIAGVRGEIMQMDAGMGAVAAVQDMFLHSRRGINYVFSGTPQRWKRAEFRDMPCEGGVLVSGMIQYGTVCELEVKAPRDAMLRLGNPHPGAAVRIEYSSGRENITSAAVLELSFKAGECCRIVPA